MSQSGCRPARTFPGRGNLETLVSLKINFLFNLLGKRNCVVCVGAAGILKRSSSKINNRSHHPMAALMAEFSFVRLSLKDKCYPQIPKVIPTSTFLRLLLPSGVNK